MTDLIDAYLAHCEAEGLAQTTIETKEVVLRMFDRELPMGLEHALEHELVELIGRKKYKVRTKFVYTIHAKEFFRYSTDRRRPAHMRLDYDPAEGLPIPRVPRGVPRPLSDSERHAVLVLAREPYRTWAEVGTLTGMRCVELAGIDLDRDDITEERVLVRAGKGGKSREIPTHPNLWSLVQGLPGGALCRTATGQPADAHYISTRAALHFRRGLKLPGVCMHRTRDTFASDLFAAGVDIRIIQELLGHDSLTSTQKYTKVRKEQCQMAIRALLPHHPAAS
jgi:site-specific recombinase XerD